LKRRPLADIEKILDTINRLVVVDNKIDSFEYLLSRMVAKYLREAKNPSRSKLHGGKKLADCAQQLSLVVSIVASHGYQTGSAGDLQKAQKAYRAGMSSVGINHTNLSFKGDWQDQLDAAVEILDKLKPADKNKVVQALAVTVSDDNMLVTAEHEMLRAVCLLIHVPLPIFNQAEYTST
ncbi:MAG: hypothetical protein HKN85_09935, partial [Gammaproteobacteria bacterium]|nr:hypothetical protein [Gammaproteobacteria bacterium]